MFFSLCRGSLIGPENGTYPLFLGVKKGERVSIKSLCSR